MLKLGTILESNDMLHRITKQNIKQWRIIGKKQLRNWPTTYQKPTAAKAPACRIPNFRESRIPAPPRCPPLPGRCRGKSCRRRGRTCPSPFPESGRPRRIRWCACKRSKQLWWLWDRGRRRNRWGRSWPDARPTRPRLHDWRGTRTWKGGVGVRGGRKRGCLHTECVKIHTPTLGCVFHDSKQDNNEKYQYPENKAVSSQI